MLAATRITQQKKCEAHTPQVWPVHINASPGAVVCDSKECELAVGHLHRLASEEGIVGVGVCLSVFLSRTSLSVELRLQPRRIKPRL